MKTRLFFFSLCASLGFSVQPVTAQNWAAQAPPYGRPDATIDLRTREGVQLIKGEWRYSDVQILQVDAKGPGADLKPSGAPVKTYDYAPHAGIAGFDDSKWAILDPGNARRTAWQWKSQFQLVSPSRYVAANRRRSFRGRLDGFL